LTDVLTSPESRYASLVSAFANAEGVTEGSERPGRPFGSNGLKVNHHIFAMLVRGRLVVKLPRERVAELVHAGEGRRYDPRSDGRLMQEWLTLSPDSTLDWVALAREALAFVRG
jgi:hypothetical protein